MKQIDEYEAFTTYERRNQPPPGYNKIRFYLIFYFLVGIHQNVQLMVLLTEARVDSVYSEAALLRELIIIPFLTEFNQMDIQATDIGNAYL